MTYEDLLELLSRRPRTTKELREHYHIDNIDMKNRLQALKSKGQVWVLNLEPMWFKKGYKLPKGATHEEIRKYSLAMWYVYDPTKHDPIKRAQRLLKDISGAVEPKEDPDNPIMGYHPITGEPQRLKDMN